MGTVHELFPEDNHNLSPKKSRASRFAGKIAAGVNARLDSAAEVMTGDQVNGSKEHMTKITNDVLSSSAGKSNMIRNEHYLASMSDGSSLAEAYGKDGSRRSLKAIFMMGESVNKKGVTSRGDVVVGVVSTSVMEDGKYVPKALDVLEMPYGQNKMHEGGGQNIRPMRSFAHVDIASLKGRMTDGMPDEVEDVIVGRFSGIDNGTVSRYQLVVSVDSQGELTYLDNNSANGTYMLDGYSL